MAAARRPVWAPGTLREPSRAVLGALPPEWAMKSRMSSLVTRPEMPVPLIFAMSTLWSFAILRTSGDER